MALFAFRVDAWALEDVQALQLMTNYKKNAIYTGRHMRLCRLDRAIAKIKGNQTPCYNPVVSLCSCEVICMDGKLRYYLTPPLLTHLWWSVPPASLLNLDLDVESLFLAGEDLRMVPASFLSLDLAVQDLEMGDHDVGDPWMEMGDRNLGLCPGGGWIGASWTVVLILVE